MARLHKLIGVFFVIASIVSLGISVAIANPDERISVIVSSAFIFLAGVLSYRSTRAWPIVVILASVLYCYLVALASTTMLFTGAFPLWWSSLVLPIRDPTIQLVAKASLVYFQGVLPLAFIAAALFSLIAAFGYPKTSYDNRA